jgi:transcriptional regulator with XRE-family HTH domain
VSDNGDHRQRKSLVDARKTRGLTQEDAAEAAGVDVSTWARWEQGRQGIRPRARARVAAVLDVPIAQVNEWLGEARPEPDLPWISADVAHADLGVTVETSRELWRWEMDPARRQILTALPFVTSPLGEWLLEQFDRPFAAPARSGKGLAVGLDDVRRIWEVRRTFQQLDRLHGGGLARPGVITFLNTHVSPMLRGSYTEEVGRRLMSAAAEMTAFAGWTAYDTGRDGLAQAHYGQALRLARAAGDDLAVARILSDAAQQCIDLGNPQWATRLATAARQSGIRARVSPRIEAVLLLMDARAAALAVSQAGSDRYLARQVQGLLATAERRFGSGRVDTDPVWIDYLTPAEFAGQSGCCWQMIGQHRRAFECFQQAAEGHGAQFRRSTQFDTVHRAEAELSLGDLDAALASATAAIPMANGLTSHRSVKLIKRFDGHLDPYGREIRVRQWRDHLRTELRAAAA